MENNPSGTKSSKLYSNYKEITYLYSLQIKQDSSKIVSRTSSVNRERMVHRVIWYSTVNKLVIYAEAGELRNKVMNGTVTNIMGIMNLLT
jgi:hypothetical protein